MPCTSRQQRTLCLAWCVLAAACLALLPAAALAYGGGGGGGGGDGADNVFGGTPRPSRGSDPPSGFSPTVPPLLDDVFVGQDPDMSPAARHEDDLEDLEKAINQAAADAARSPKPVRLTPRQAAQRFLDPLPPEVRQQLTSSYTPEEILVIRDLGSLTDMVRNARDPIARQVAAAALVKRQTDFTRSVAARRDRWDRQRQEAIAIQNKVAQMFTSTALGTLPVGTLGGIALGATFSTITDGTKGTATSLATSALMSPFPGGKHAAHVARNALRDTLVEEALSQSVNAYNSK